MELREWATRILSADSLDEKLLTPAHLTDEHPGSPIFWDTPSRPAHMQFQKHTRKDRLPKLEELFCPDKRAICLHRFAGHELLAVEIMAYALLAFPDAPKYFRKGLASTLKEEQGHVQLYSQRLRDFGVEFGDLPLYKHFWSYVPFLKTPSQYVSVLSLTFEMANLDFAPLFRNTFLQYDDILSANLMNQILEDEIAHVSFGYQWLKKFKPKEQSDWEAWRMNVPEKLSLNRARGAIFQEQPRKEANIPDFWIAQMKEH